MKIIDLINSLTLGIKVRIINCNDDLLFEGLSGDINEKYFLKTLKSNVVMILEIKDNELKILSDYLL